MKKKFCKPAIVAFFEYLKYIGYDVEDLIC